MLLVQYFFVTYKMDMKIGMIGISMKSSELSLRELLAKACPKCLSEGSAAAALFHVVLLSTCHRTEIYFSSDDLAATQTQLLHLLQREIQQPFEHQVYSYFGSDCFVHLAMVTAGMDSLILGETEIQGQVKNAYETACLFRSLPSCIHFLFQKALKIAKEARTCFSSFNRKSTLEGLIYNLSVDLKKRPSLFFIGNSEINRKILSFFKCKGIEEIVLCTRSPHSAKDLGVDVVDWSGLQNWKNYDVVISGTNHHEYLLSPVPHDQGITSWIFDLSMPRSVDPRFASHPRITLLNMEELGRVVEKQESGHNSDAQRVRQALCQAALRQHQLYNIKQHVATCV